MTLPRKKVDDSIGDAHTQTYFSTIIRPNECILKVDYTLDNKTPWQF